jgi:hypothetical protein
MYYEEIDLSKHFTKWALVVHVILATQEAKIKRILVQSHPRQIVP